MNEIKKYQDALDEIEYELREPATWDNPMPERKCQKEIGVLQDLINEVNTYRWHTDPNDLPKKGRKVLLTVEWGERPYKYTCCAYYYRKFEQEFYGDAWDYDEDEFDYNEEEDEYYLKEGWYEYTYNSEEYTYCPIPENHKILAWRYIEEYRR